MNQFATLIVEDTSDIQESYKRSIERKAGIPIVAATYDEAIAAVKRRFFPVAIIDVRLSEDDETNVDGLRVLEFIHQVGNSTKAILITGYGSFEIAREAFKKYQVFEGLEKGVSLATIENTIDRALQRFKEQSTHAKPSYSEMLNGSLTALWEWEDRALRLFSPKGGAEGLYRFLATLLPEFIPLIQDAHKLGCSINDSKKVAAGIFWSRGRGLPVLIAFGQKAAVVKLQSDSEPADLKDLFPNTALRVGALIKKAELHGLYGIVRELANAEFSLFDSSGLQK